MKDLKIKRSLRLVMVSVIMGVLALFLGFNSGKRSGLHESEIQSWEGHCNFTTGVAVCGNVALLRNGVPQLETIYGDAPQMLLCPNSSFQWEWEPKSDIFTGVSLGDYIRIELLDSTEPCILQITNVIISEDPY